jgi:hypothetical protein
MQKIKPKKPPETPEIRAERDRLIVQLLNKRRASSGMRPVEVAEVLAIPTHEAATRLWRLARRGLIEREFAGKDGQTNGTGRSRYRKRQAAG